MQGLERNVLLMEKYMKDKLEHVVVNVNGIGFDSWGSVFELDRNRQNHIESIWLFVDKEVNHRIHMQDMGIASNDQCAVF